ncbi:MAG: hypothetical protein KGO92_08015, partial [Bacteroidota bacterium]|nr:hypothetical protein [Bacteroidota bacterium]
MKLVSLIICLGIGTLTLSAQQKAAEPNKPDPQKKLVMVDAACGECQFGMKGKSCDLAIRMNGKTYFVDGTNIDDHGDAHAKDGFCHAVRKAKVQGEIVNGRFRASYFQ